MFHKWESCVGREFHASVYTAGRPPQGLKCTPGLNGTKTAYFILQLEEWTPHRVCGQLGLMDDRNMVESILGMAAGAGGEEGTQLLLSVHFVEELQGH